MPSQFPCSSNTDIEVSCNCWKAPPSWAKFNDLCLKFYFCRIDWTRLALIFCPMKGKFNFEISRIRAATRSQQLYFTVFESTVKCSILLYCKYHHSNSLEVIILGGDNWSACTDAYCRRDGFILGLWGKQHKASREAKLANPDTYPALQSVDWVRD